jgi:hypothetical protein
MVLFLRRSVTAFALCTLLFCVSCEKHPLGQMPEVQREQSDPAKRDWSAKSETDKSEASPAPVEAAPHEAR